MPIRLSILPKTTKTAGLYIISPTKTGTRYKVGMSTDLRKRLNSYHVCFPKGFWIVGLVIFDLPYDANMTKEERRDRFRKVLMQEKRLAEIIKAGGRKKGKNYYIEETRDITGSREWYKFPQREAKGFLNALVGGGAPLQGAVYANLSSIDRHVKEEDFIIDEEIGGAEVKRMEQELDNRIKTIIKKREALGSKGLALSEGVVGRVLTRALKKKIEASKPRRNPRRTAKTVAALKRIQRQQKLFIE